MFPVIKDSVINIYTVKSDTCVPYMSWFYV